MGNIDEKGFDIESESEYPRFEVKVSSSKQDLNTFSISELRDIKDSIENNPDNNVYFVSVNINELNDKGENIGEVLESIVVIFANSACYQVEDMLMDADKVTEDISKYAQYLAISEQFKKDDEEYMDMSCEYGKNLVCGAIHRFYIYPNYRKLGIGRHIMNSLDSIIERALNIKIRCLIIYPKPDDGQESSMLETMIKVIEQNGFTHVKDNYYVKDYLEESYE